VVRALVSGVLAASLGAALLFSCRAGDARGTAALEDALLTCWYSGDEKLCFYVYKGGNQRCAGDGCYSGTLFGEGTFSRETASLISLASDDGGTPETVQTERTEDGGLVLHWRQDGVCHSLELTAGP